MERALWKAARWLLGSGPEQRPSYLWARWLFLRALGVVFFSAFYSLVFQIRGLIGPDGILPAGGYLEAVAQHLGAKRFWFAPTLLWLGSGPLALHFLCAVGLLASLLLVLNLWPRGSIAACLVAFLSFVSAAQDFSEYQSDGMLLAAGFIGLFFAPPGLRPRVGVSHPPSRASLFLLRWLWFRIYFESGVAKIGSGDPEWRHLTAMDHYYEYGPLPNWIGWYAQQLPHPFHAAVALLTLVIELGLVWTLFLPRRFRIVCFLIVTPFQLGIALTANLTFLNYFVLALGVLLLDDEFLRGIVHRVRARAGAPRASPLPVAECPGKAAELRNNSALRSAEWESSIRSPKIELLSAGSGVATPDSGLWSRISLVFTGFFLGWISYDTTALLLFMIFPRLPLPTAPILALEPFRIANQYGLFAVMTRARYEIEFQGTRDGQTWIPYPFRYKPQHPRQPPQVFAPYQPRFDWNLWFASLGRWRQYPVVVRTQAQVLKNSPSVLSLFARNPFPDGPPRQIRAVHWQYWFTDLRTKRTKGLWWRREYRGLYAPTLEREPDGGIVVVEWPEVTSP